MFWACAQIEPFRERLALHTLGLAGFEVYCPRLREQVRISWPQDYPHAAALPRLCLCVGRFSLVEREMVPGCASHRHGRRAPAHVPDAVIAEIRSRERNGLVELVKSRGLRPGTKVRVVDGPLASQIGVLLLLKPRERVLVLLSLLGGERRVDLARNAIEAV